MVRDMSLRNSIGLDKGKILAKINKSQDTCVDTIDMHASYSLKAGIFPYTHGRPLPKKTANKAVKYIRAITSKYPFQLRMMLALPLWEKFAQEWCETGDELKSLKAI